jgi:hypothetical protein
MLGFQERRQAAVVYLNYILACHVAVLVTFAFTVMV